MALVLGGAAVQVAAQLTIDTLEYPGPGNSTGFGLTIAGVGDVDGDGHDDFVAGTFKGGTTGELLAEGIVQIFSGADRSVIRQWTGDAAMDYFGLCVDSAGDVDGDGTQDVVVGAPHCDAAGTDAGVVRVYSGATGALLHDLAGLAAGDWFGQVVAGVGDLDHDGHGDFAGATNQPNSGFSAKGYVRVVSGADGHELARIEGQLDGQGLGSNVRPAGDFDADGTPDVAIMTQEPFGGPKHALVWSGAWIVNRTPPAVLLDYSDATLGLAVGTAGDLDGDGFSELLLGTPFLDVGYPLGQTGGWLAISGRDHSVQSSWAGTLEAQWAGWTIAGAGDIDRDSVGDFLLGTPSLGMPQDGPTRVFSGADGTLLYTCPPGAGYQAFGQGLAGVGDLNADGLLDWAVGEGLAGSSATEIWLYSPAGVWEDLGHGLAGSAGVPSLSGAGLLFGGDAMSLMLAGALPSQPFVLVIGLEAVNLPFHGVVFVPDGDLLLFDVTDVDGSRQWSEMWPPGVPAMSFYFQAWIEDPMAAEGWAASNGLRAQSP